MKPGLIPTSELREYALTRINDLALSDSVEVGVFYEFHDSTENCDKIIQIYSEHPAYETQGVTILDSVTWFECKTFAEVDTALALFAKSPRDNREVLPEWGETIEETRAA